MGNPIIQQSQIEQIKGIGPAIARTLAEAGVHTCADLAQCDEAWLAELLQARFSFITREKIARQRWIEHARQLADESPAGEFEQRIDPLEVPAFERRHTQIEDKFDDRRNPRRPGWDSKADFYISFGRPNSAGGAERELQIEVHHFQSDQTKTWPALKGERLSGERLLAWMLAQAGVEIQPENVEVRANMENEHTDEVAGIRLDDLSVSHRRETDGSDKLVVACEMSIEGADALELTYERQPYAIEIHLVNVEDQNARLVCTKENYLIPDQVVYDIECEAPVPQAGVYDFYLLARILPPLNIPPAQIQGPVVRVQHKSRKE